LLLARASQKHELGSLGPQPGTLKSRLRNAHWEMSSRSLQLSLTRSVVPSQFPRPHFLSTSLVYLINMPSDGRQGAQILCSCPRGENPHPNGRGAFDEGLLQHKAGTTARNVPGSLGTIPRGYSPSKVLGDLLWSCCCLRIVWYSAKRDRTSKTFTS
jgi:hypothetical protein